MFSGYSFVTTYFIFNGSNPANAKMHEKGHGQLIHLIDMVMEEISFTAMRHAFLLTKGSVLIR